MHSFHHSRGRILFEVACALTVSASCVGAWMDLGTPAFLPAAAVSAFYGLVHLFDMRRKPAIADVAIADRVEADQWVDAAPHEAGPATVEAEPQAAVSEPKPAKQTKKPSRKRSKKAVGPAVVAEPTEETMAVAEGEPLAPIQDAGPVAESDPFSEETIGDDAESAEPATFEEPEHWPVTPLFEPEPFVRQQRAVFGRKAG